MSLKVCETFYSLLGESSLAGLPAFFIRLSGCNLRCRYCDTKYAYDEGQKMEVAELIQAAQARPTRLALVTGGEPLLQPDAKPLLAGLSEAGFTVLLETNGSQPIKLLGPKVRRILDIKCPGSGMAEHNLWDNLELLTVRDEIKFVITDEDDFRWALEVVNRYHLVGHVPVLVSPVFGAVSAKEVAAWIIRSGRPLRLNLQLHKYIWGPEARGV